MDLSKNKDKTALITLFYLIVMLVVASIGILNFLENGDASNFRWVYGSIFSILLGSIPYLLNKKYNLDVPWILSILICLALFLHIAGGIFDWYHIIQGYDHITHFISGFIVAVLAFTAIYILDRYWSGLHMNTYAMAFMVIIFAMAMGATWEIIEFSMDTLLGTNEQFDGLRGTMLDLIFDAIAGILTAIIGVYLINKGEMQTLTQNLGERIDHVLIHKKKKQ